MDLITRRVIKDIEGSNPYPNLKAYADPDSSEYREMIGRIGKELNFTSLRFHRLDDMIEAVGLPKEKLCTYCWDGRE